MAPRKVFIQKDFPSIPLPDAIPLEQALEDAMAIGARRNVNLSATRDDLLRALQPGRLAGFESAHKRPYASAAPFPHTFIDGLLPETVLERLNKELPERYWNVSAKSRVQGCSKMVVLFSRLRS